MPEERMDYQNMSREQLALHCEAYAEAIHELARKAMELEERRRNLERIRSLFHG